ncbi:MAG: bifunctional nuclease family protein [Myxococcales bacterium]|nr:bifunctional nuclease family protein [Myxococcales bacterium]
MAERRFIPVVVRGLALDPESNQPVLLLQDATARLLLPIWIGAAEAAGIAARLSNERPARPLTADLVHSVLGRLGARVERLDVRAVEDGVFLGDLLVRDASGRVHRIDCRPSDGVALVLRDAGVIRVERAVMEEARPMDLAELDPPRHAISADDEAGRARLLATLGDLDPAELGLEM